MFQRINRYRDDLVPRCGHEDDVLLKRFQQQKSTVPAYAVSLEGIPNTSPKMVSCLPNLAVLVANFASSVTVPDRNGRLSLTASCQGKESTPGISVVSPHEEDASGLGTCLCSIADGQLGVVGRRWSDCGLGRGSESGLCNFGRRKLFPFS
ncbi:hypothetical protein BJ508DRAFT_380647, partial [Ascobolus immersus RN42]